MPAGYPIFAAGVESDQAPDSLIMYPIVLVSGSKYLIPPQPGSEDNGQKPSDFVQTYYLQGNSYDAYSAGARLGALKVTGAAEGNMSFNGRATAAKSQKIPIELQFLATSLPAVKPHAATRRVATAQEQSEALEAAKAVLRNRGYAAQNVSKTKLDTPPVLLTDLDMDGAPELIGSFVMETASRRHRLFLALTKSETGWKPVLTSLEHCGSEGEKTGLRESYYDQLDLNGDGVDELFAIAYGWEGWTYRIYQRVEGSWKKVYEGAGDGV